MKKVLKYNIFIILILLKISLIKSECGFEENFPFEYKNNISTLSEKNKSKALKITFIYSTMDNQKELLSKISNDNMNNIKQTFSEIAYSFSKILNSTHSFLIPTNKEKICGDKINILQSNILETSLNTDLIIYPYLDNEISNFKSGICAIDKITNKPIIALIGLPINYNYTDKNYFLGEMIHNMIHILGFNLNSMYNYGFKTKNESKYLLFHSKKISNLAYIITSSIYIKKNNIPLSLNHTIHYDKFINLTDIMSEDNYHNFIISKITLHILKKSHWYIINNLGCNLVLNTINGECLLIGQNCYFEKKYLNITNFYPVNGLIKCFYDHPTKKIFYMGFNIYQEYLFKSEYNSIMKYKSEYFDYTYEKFVKDHPELNKIDKQELKLLNPSKYCTIPHRTVFFSYPPTTEMKQNLSEYNITNITLTNKQKEYFVLAHTYSEEEYDCLHQTLDYNNVIRVNESNSSNFIYNARLTYLKKIFKYQKYFAFIAHFQITKKDNLYKNYLKLKAKFPKDFNYLPKTYILPRQKNYVYEKFKNYKPTLKNLWLIKPTYGDQGRGIRILKSIKDLKKYRSCIITKYLSKPNLVNGKKYDLRMYVLVSSVNPLIIYVYNDGLVRVATENYKLSLKTLHNLFMHLTNTSLNDKSKKFIINDNPDAELGNTWTLHALKKKFWRENFNFDKIMNEIKDFSIKTIISMINYEINFEELTGYYDNNVFGLFGIDVLIDYHLKPWLIEVNAFPSLMSYTKVDSIIKTKLLTDLENILGIIPYNHINGKCFDGDYLSQSFVKEKVERAICEISRFSGGFERVFPIKSNVDYYKKFFSNVSQENLLLWERLKNIEEEI